MAGLTATADWKALFAHWSEAIGDGELHAIGQLGEASLERLMGATGQAGLGLRAAQAAMGHDQAGGFAVLYYLMALRGVEALHPPSWLVVDQNPEIRPQVSLIVPVHNRWLLTLNCLRSVLIAHTTVRCEVLLADDASSDATAELAEKNPWLRAIRSEQNLGFLENCNHAAQVARGELLVLLNNDTLVGDQWLDRLWTTLQHHPEAGVVGSQVYGPDGTVQESGGILWGDGEVWNHGRGYGPDRWFEINHAREVDYVSGCALAIRRTLWEQLGGFDTAYRPAYAEDTDLCLRVRQAGSTVMVQPHSRILHLEGLSHSRNGEGGLKRYQSLNLSTLRQRWLQVLMTEQPLDKSRTLLASDRGLRRGPVALVLQLPPSQDPSGSVGSGLLVLIQALQMREFKVVLLLDPENLHSVGRLELEGRGVLCVPLDAAVGDGMGWLGQQVPWLDVIVDLGTPKPGGLRESLGGHYPDAFWLQVEALGLEGQTEERSTSLVSSLLPDHIRPRSVRVQALAGGAVSCHGVDLLASSQGLHPDGWLEVENVLVLAPTLMGNQLRVELYLPGGDTYTPVGTLETVMGWGLPSAIVKEHSMMQGINSLRLRLPSESLTSMSCLSLRLKGIGWSLSSSVNDRRRLLAVLTSLVLETA